MRTNDQTEEPSASRAPDVARLDATMALGGASSTPALAAPAQASSQESAAAEKPSQLEEILRQLVTFKSISGRYEETTKAIDFVAEFVRARGMHTQIHEWKGHPSLFATTQPNSKKPRVLLAAHIDVVPAPDEQFYLQEKNGRYYGRGAADMKFAIAAYLQLIDELKGSLADYDLGLMITSDEELGGTNGTKQLVQRGFSADIVILPDTGDTPDAWKFEKSAKGRVMLKILAEGKSAHASRPWKGENAIEKLIASLEEIQKLFTGQGPETDTISVTTINGGEASNQVPQSAAAQLDLRIMSEESGRALVAKIQQICEMHGAQAIENPEEFCTPIINDPANPLVANFLSTVESVAGTGKIAHANSTGSSDARFFAAVGVPCIVAGPPADGYHSPEEWVSKEGLSQFCEVLRRYVDQVARNK